MLQLEDDRRSRATARLYLAYRPPLDWGSLLGYLAARATPGIEAVDAGGRYCRSIRLHGHMGYVAVSPVAAGNGLLVEPSVGASPGPGSASGAPAPAVRPRRGPDRRFGAPRWRSVAGAAGGATAWTPGRGRGGRIRARAASGAGPAGDGARSDDARRSARPPPRRAVGRRSAGVRLPADCGRALGRRDPRVRYRHRSPSRPGRVRPRARPCRRSRRVARAHQRYEGGGSGSVWRTAQSPAGGGRMDGGIRHDARAELARCLSRRGHRAAEGDGRPLPSAPPRRGGILAAVAGVCRSAPVGQPLSLTS